MKRKNRNTPGRAYERRRQARIRAGKPEPTVLAKDIRSSANQDPAVALFLYRVLKQLRGCRA